MRAGFAIELTFDPETAAKLAALWDTIARAGISTFMQDVGAFPHISLAVFDDIECQELRKAIAEFAHSVTPMDVILSAVGTFPGDEGVVFVAPVVTPELLDMHARLQQVLKEHGFEPWDHYVPGKWFPHCTVAMELGPDPVCKALDLCRASDVFGPGQLTGLSIVEFRPVREICAFPLGMPEGQRAPRDRG